MGVEFLSQVAEGRPPAVQEKVVVIGGGNVDGGCGLSTLSARGEEGIAGLPGKT